MSWKSPNWSRDRLCRVELPSGYPDSPWGIAQQIKIDTIQANHTRAAYRAETNKLIAAKFKELINTGTNTDVAKTPKKLEDRIYWHFGILLAMCYDICILVRLYDDRTKFNAIVQKWSSILNFGNIPFSIS